MSNQRIISVLENYTGDQSSLDAFVAVVTEELGDDWTGKIYDEMADVSDGIKERLDHAFNYYAATTAWNELQSYLSQDVPLDYAKTLERVPVLEHWLSFFGAAGDDAIFQLKNKLRQEGEKTHQNTSSLTEPFAQEQYSFNEPVLQEPHTDMVLDEQTQHQVQDIFVSTPEIHTEEETNHLNPVLQQQGDNQEELSDEIKSIFGEPSEPTFGITENVSDRVQNTEVTEEKQSQEMVEMSKSDNVLAPSFGNDIETSGETTFLSKPELSGEMSMPVDEQLDVSVFEAGVQSVEPVFEPDMKVDDKPIEQLTSPVNHAQENKEIAFFDTPRENNRTDVFDPIASHGAAQENNAQTVQDEKTWLIGKIFRQIDFISNIESWISFRCLELGYTDFYTYRYYGFLVDVLDKTIAEIKGVLEQVELYDLIEMRYPNGVQYLQNRLLAYEKESQEAHENVLSDLSELPNENLSVDDLKRRLGGMDTSMEKEYLGPAPDGFEMIDDPYEKLDEVAVQKEYEKIEAEGNLMPSATVQPAQQQSVSTAPLTENPMGDAKSSSQMPQNGVQRKMTFSFKTKPAIKPDGTGGATS